jgi:hypothetical protein
MSELLTVEVEPSVIAMTDAELEEIEFPDSIDPDPEPDSKSDAAAPVVPHQDVALPVTIDHLMIAHIIRITSPREFKDIFADFESQIEAKLIPLKAYLRKVIMTTEVQQLEQHAAHVERWRSDCTRFLSLASGFVEHGKSSHFLVEKQRQEGGRKLTESERDAYRRTLTAGYSALVLRLAGLVDDIDSRVNLCKRFTDNEKAGFKNFGGVIPANRSSYQ